MAMTEEQKAEKRAARAAAAKVNKAAQAKKDKAKAAAKAKNSGEPDRIVIPDGKVRIAELDRSREIARKRIETGDTRPTVTQVPLKKQPEPMTTRWGNTAINGRAHDLSENKGWIPVRFEELQSPNSGEFKATAEGGVARGANQHQVLYKIPSAVYKEIARSKANRLNRSLKSKKTMGQGAAEAAGTAGHDRAAERIGKIGIDKFESSKSLVALGEDDE